MRIEFKVFGKPCGKERHRTGKYGTYTPAKTVAYEAEVRRSFYASYGSRIMPFPNKTPVRVLIAVYFKTPKNISKKTQEDMVFGKIKPTKKPDGDNIAKIVMDALNGAAWKDDAQVVSLIVHKYYVPDEPYIHVILEDV